MFNAIVKLLKANPLGMFVYSILGKWYLMIAVGGIVVTFWVFSGLEKAGVLQAATKTVSEAINDAKSVAKYCVPLIADLKSFWNCVENPPQYSPSTDEENLEKGLMNTIEKDLLKKDYPTNPYDK